MTPAQFDYKLLRACGSDVFISPMAEIRRPNLISIGNHVAIDSFVVLTTAADIGDYTHISPHCSIIGGAESRLIMEDFSGMAAGCRVICGSDDFTGQGLINPTVPQKYRVVNLTTITLKRFATLGTNVVVHPGVTIGEGAVVGSCSQVTKDLEPWGIYVGSPARRINSRNKEQVLSLAEQLAQENG